VFDDEALRSAMDGVDDVFYCVVDTRAWLRDPAPLFRTNVEGLQHVLDTPVDADLHRFVFTSSIGTIGIPTEGRPAAEDDEFNWADKGGGYIQSRVAAENLVLKYARAADEGRNGERYIISERFMTARELYAAAADAGDATPPRFGIPLRAMYVLGFAGDVAATVLRRDMALSTLSVRLMHVMSPMDHGKAERELGWRPEPVHDSIEKATHWYRDHRNRSPTAQG
jgi:dihydroflavonol-4-reductase